MVDLPLDLDGEVVLIDKTVGLGLIPVVPVIGLYEDFVKPIEDFFLPFFVHVEELILKE